MAMVSPQITVEVVEANEFQEIASQYSVYGVPKTVINDKVEFDGAVPEVMFLKNVLKGAEA